MRRAIAAAGSGMCRVVQSDARNTRAGETMAAAGSVVQTSSSTKRGQGDGRGLCSIIIRVLLARSKPRVSAPNEMRAGPGLVKSISGTAGEIAGTAGWLNVVSCRGGVSRSCPYGTLFPSF